MKAIIVFSVIALVTLLNAKTLIEEQYVRVISSHPIYETVHRLHNNERCYFSEDRFERKHQHKKRYKHIVGYKNIGYYHGMKIIKKSHRKLRNILIEVAITF